MLKRKLAALLAGAMVLTSLPMVSFAASDNSIVRRVTAKKDTVFYLNDGNYPSLLIEEKENQPIQAGDKIRLIFENAKWVGKDEKDGEIVQADVYKLLSNKVVEVTLEAGDNVIPLLTELTGEGEAKVTIEPLGTVVTPSTLVFATVGSGATKVSVGDTRKFYNSVQLKDIMIDELKPDTLKLKEGEKIKFKLPKNFEWDEELDGDSFNFTTGGGLTGPIPATIHVEENILEFEFTDDYSGSRSVIGSLIIPEDTLTIKTTDDDAAFGDVEVEVSGAGVTKEKIKVAERVKYDVVVKTDGDVPELFAGRLVNNGDDDAHKLVKIVIKEDLQNSWWDSRNTYIDFPEGVKVVSVISTNQDDKAVGTINKDRDRITLVAANDAKLDGGKYELELEIKVSIAADFEGDLVATVNGPALGFEEELTVAKVIQPIDVKVTTTNVDVGYKDIKANDVVITEAKAGALDKGYLYLVPEYMAFEDTKDIKVEVVEGDLKLGSVKVVNIDGFSGALRIEVKSTSDEASVIKVSGLETYVSRALAEGSYSLGYFGNAIIQNAGDDPLEFDTEYLEVPDFIKVVTPAPHKGETGKSALKASFTVGSAEYTVGDEVATADVAPYIQDGRTMVPVKYVAYALGIDPQQVQWDQATKTVTIYGDKVVNITIGSKSIVVGGTPVPMDTEAVVKDGRTFVPIAFAARALGVPYTFDDATKTVTFN